MEGVGKKKRGTGKGIGGIVVLLHHLRGPHHVTSKKKVTVKYLKISNNCRRLRKRQGVKKGKIASSVSRMLASCVKGGGGEKGGKKNGGICLFPALFATVDMAARAIRRIGEKGKKKQRRRI